MGRKAIWTQTLLHVSPSRGLKSRFFFFFEPQTASVLRNPFLPSHEAWVAYALFFSIFGGTPVVERGEVMSQGGVYSRPAGYHMPALPWDCTGQVPRKRETNAPASGPVGSDLELHPVPFDPILSFLYTIQYLGLR